MPTIVIEPSDREGEFRLTLTERPLAMWYDGNYQDEVPITLVSGATPVITFNPTSVTPDYASAAEGLLGDRVSEELRTCIAENRDACEVSDEDADHIILRLREYLASQPICEICADEVAESGTRTCHRHRDEIIERVETGDTSYEEVAEMIVGRLELHKLENLLDDADKLRYAAIIARMCHTYIPQDQWPTLIKYTKVTEAELARLRTLINPHAELIVNLQPNNGMRMLAQLAEWSMLALIIRQLRGKESTPSYMRR